MPSTLAPPTSVPISAAAAVVTTARSLVLPEPKLLIGDLTRDIADLSWSSPAPVRRDNALHRHGVPNRPMQRVLKIPRFRAGKTQPRICRHRASRLSGPAPANAR